MSFNFRALELHGRRMWDRANIVAALDAIERYGLTTLVLHETDMLQHILFPRAFFDPYAQWSGAPARRGENAIQNNRVYLDHVLRLAKSRGIEVWLEVKELTFPDEVLEYRPELIKNGQVCPSEAFWTTFLEARTTELFQDFPAIAGLIVSLGSPEGRAARAQNKCKCEVCARTPLPEWYRRLTAAIHKPVKAAGKRLAVREFAYKPVDHKPLLEALDELPSDIILCAKVTPHDFYPTFPDNPAIRKHNRPLWIEYDVLGQFYGWGLFPCIVTADIGKRIEHARAAGATGGLFRVEWERINDMWCLDNFNVLNLVAAARHARGESASTQELAEIWLKERGGPSSATSWLAGILDLTWPIVRAALYIDGFVFADCSMFPRSVGRAWWTMERKHSLAEWDPKRANDLKMSSARFSKFMAEKAEAVTMAADLMKRLDKAPANVPPALLAAIRAPFDLLPIYVRGLSLCAEICLYTRWSEEGTDGGPKKTEFAAALNRMEHFEQEMETLANDMRLPHQRIMMLDYRRIADIRREGVAAYEGKLGAKAGSAA